MSENSVLRSGIHCTASGNDILPVCQAKGESFRRRKAAKAFAGRRAKEVSYNYSAIVGEWANGMYPSKTLSLQTH